MDATKLSRYIYTLGMNYKNSLRKDSAGVKFTLFLFLSYVSKSSIEKKHTSREEA